MKCPMCNHPKAGIYNTQGKSRNQHRGTDSETETLICRRCGFNSDITAIREVPMKDGRGRTIKDIEGNTIMFPISGLFKFKEAK